MIIDRMLHATGTLGKRYTTPAAALAYCAGVVRDRHELEEPIEAIAGHREIDCRKAMLTGKMPEFTCLVGTMVQEVYTKPIPPSDTRATAVSVDTRRRWKQTSPKRSNHTAFG